MTRKLWFSLAASLSLVLVISCIAGCQSKATRDAIQQSQEQYQIAKAQVENDDKLAADKATADAQVKDAQAKANPTGHPFRAASVTANEARKPLGFIATVAFLICLGSIGLAFTPLSFISKVLVPVSGIVTFGSFVGVIVLPLFPYVVIGGGVLLLALVAYEAYRYRNYLLNKLPPPPPAVRVTHS
jgi:hypothetical protein